MAIRSRMAKSFLLLLIAATLVHALDGTCLMQRSTSMRLKKTGFLEPAAGRPSALTGLRLSDGFMFGGLDVVEAPEVSKQRVHPALEELSGSGILCQTLLHQEVHDKHFMAFAEGGLGMSLASGLDKELKRQCKKAFNHAEWAHLSDNYSGSWSDHMVAARDNEIFGSLGAWLNDVRQQSQKPATTWDSFRNDGDRASEFEGLIRHVAHGPLTRVMDYGCGDGVELAKTARGFGIAADDTLCIEVRDGLSADARSNVTLLLLETEEDAYTASLEAYLNKGVRGTVSAIFSSVTFHHITKPGMRTAALNFVKEALSPDGVFLFSEWDNVGTPIDFSIYFDLAHYLPALFFSDPAPTEISMAPLDTMYLPVQGWVDLMSSNGLPFDRVRSTFNFMTPENETVALDPFAAAERSSGRNFLAVFGKAS